MIDAHRERLRRFLDRCYIALMSLLPSHFLSWLMFHLARVRAPAVKGPLIGVFARLYRVNMAEAEFEQLKSYPDFNTFFTRALKPGARKLDPNPRVLISPVDGTVSQCGPIQNHTLLQAKGHTYTVAELLGSDDLASGFRNGTFCTVYLAPSNYHRIHMPLTGRLSTWTYQPGRLFSVSARAVRKIPRLFVRNERVGALFDTDFGPLGVVLVGALFVGSIETAWAGRVTPPHGQSEGVYSTMSPVVLLRGRELGRFNMGSTVILLAPSGMVQWRPYVKPGTPVRLGLGLGELTPVKRGPKK